jgi:hypothetical protein
MKKQYAVNKARLMTRAWAIAKNLTGDISARLSMALRMAWNETKTAFFLISIGAKAWKHPESGEIRIYMNRVSDDLLEIEKDYYHTGNLSSFSWRGHQTSNCQGKRIITALDGAYYEVKTGRIITNRWADRDTADTVKAALAEAIAARM